LDVPAHAQDVVTSAQASAELLAADLPAGSPVLTVGSPALAQEMAAVGLRPVASATDRPAAVVQGYGPQVGWALLAEACVAIRDGARWVATNLDATMPSPRGPLPGNGSLVAAVRTALGGREPDLVVGKPEPGLFVASLRHCGVRDAGRALVVGDRLDTDIEGARRAGMASLLVLTGVSTPADLMTAPEHQRPDYVSADLSVLSTVEDEPRVPQWQDGVTVSDGWRVEYADHRLVLSRTVAAAGDEVAALRALAAAAWANPQWTAVRAADDHSSGAIAKLDLTRRS
jgi:glycerol 3-phosphatase-2